MICTIVLDPEDGSEVMQQTFLNVFAVVCRHQLIFLAGRAEAEALAECLKEYKIDFQVITPVSITNYHCQSDLIEIAQA